jgi:hypothetical protein
VKKGYTSRSFRSVASGPKVLDKDTVIIERLSLNQPIIHHYNSRQSLPTIACNDFFRKPHFFYTFVTDGHALVTVHSPHAL